MHTKHNFLKITTLVMSLFLTAGAICAEPSEKPNILIILADDLTWYDAGCYGNPDVKTPNIDKLAKDGLLFTRAFTATAMCSPTRQQLYTGIFPVRNGAYPNHSKVKKGTKSIVHHLGEFGYKVGLEGKKHFGPPESFPFDKELKEIPTDDSTPFCLIYASHYPHLEWPEPEGYSPEELTVPPYLVDNQKTREALCMYYTEVTQFDAEVGELLETLEKSGKANNTIVIVTSEQGSAFPSAKWTCYDDGLKTQFIVRWPGVIKPGSKTDAMIQYVDVVPTLIELLGGDPATIDTGLPGASDGGNGFDGKSFLPVLLGKTDEHNDFVFGVHTTRGIINGKPYGVRSIRGKQYKYILNLMPESSFQNNITQKDKINCWESWVEDSSTNPKAAMLVKRYTNRPAEEFYNIKEDPHELNNLANDPEYREQMDVMKKQLQDWMLQQEDKGIETELGKKKWEQLQKEQQEE